MANSRKLWSQKLLGHTTGENANAADLRKTETQRRGNAQHPLTHPSRSAGTQNLAQLAARNAKNNVLSGKRAVFEGCILGIDPSLRGSGFAVIDFQAGKEPKLLFSKTLKLKQDLSFADCLGEIYKTCSDCCYEYPVKHVALEETIYVNNFKIAQILGAARGAAIAAANVLGLPIFEYPPLRIKQAVVGFGRASKGQVAGMTKQILKLDEALAFDESDASAAALCHAYSFRA
ncbi:MAG: crossover junction endodeoxyribonuclease RuvC [Opitutales bacterium]|nr:crossover junction endodeoxyribonuclease RuvC [Opitutales bacterium]